MSKKTIKTTTPEMETMPEAIAEKEVFAGHEPLPCEFATMSISDYLDSDTSAPVYQRPYVWQAKQADALIDSIVNGYPLPAIIIADITDSGKTLSLLIDGVQRTTTIRQYIDGVDVADEYASAQLDHVLSAPINVMRIKCNGAAQAAELFIRYNSGSSLNGIQRTKASLPTAILAQVQLYITWAQSFGVPKMGKVTPDTAAMMLAAAIADGNKATSAGASAGKVLASADTVPAMPQAMSIVQDAINMCDADTAGKWLSPARLVPLVMAVNDGKIDTLTADTLKAWLTAFNPDCKDRYSIRTVGKGKNPVTSSKPMTVSSAFGDTGNGHGATNARYWVIMGALERAHNGAPKTEAEAVADAIKCAMASKEA